MFNLEHILYMIISGIITAALLFILAKTVKSQKNKDLILKISALSTVIIHFSNLWVDFFKNGGTAYVEGVHLFPLFPCNAIMWMVFILSFLENKKGLLFKLLAEYCFTIGLICGVVGIILNQNFALNPTLSDYNVLKGMLSHSTMIFSCIYLFVGGYVRPNISSTISAAFGVSIFIICGLATNLICKFIGIASPDGMWLNGAPYIGISTLILFPIALLIYFGIFALIDLRLPREERWYSKLKKHFKK